MGKTRQDAWTKEEDVLLAETVLQHISKGKTQLDAFKQVGEYLSRTSAACGFRWNAQIRKQHTDAILIAKDNRKKSNDLRENRLSVNLENETLEKTISYLEKIRENVSSALGETSSDQEKYIIQLKKDNQQLKQEISRYEMAWSEMENLWKWIKDEAGHS